MSAWVAKLPRLCRYTAPHEAVIVYNLCLYLEAKGWKVTQTDSGADYEREALVGETPEARAQEVAELVGEVDDMLTVYCVSPTHASRFMLVGGNGVDVIHDHGTSMTEAMDGFNTEAASLVDDRSTHEVLGLALARIAELENLLRQALPIIDAHRAATGGDGDTTALAIRTALGDLP